MKKLKTPYDKFIVLAMVLFVMFTYDAMRSLVYMSAPVSQLSSFITLIFVVMGICSLLFAEKKNHTKFSLLWIIWCVWLLIDFFVLGLRGGGIASIFNVTFCPMVFIFFYTAGQYSEKVLDYSIWGFLAVYMVSIFFVVKALLQINILSLGEDAPALNLIFWCLCPLPLLLLRDRSLFQYVVLLSTLIMIILTGKRSATISIALILFIYIRYFMKSVRSRTGSFVGVLIAIVIGYIVVTQYLDDTFYRLINRFKMLNEDQGSGRIPIYEDVLKYLGQSSPLELLFGHGYGSIVITRHSAAHNDALQMLFEFGIVGLVVYIIMLVCLIKRCRILKKICSPYYLSYLSSVVITIVLGCFSDLVVFYSYFAFLCTLWGSVEAKLVNERYLPIKCVVS